MTLNTLLGVTALWLLAFSAEAASPTVAEPTLAAVAQQPYWQRLLHLDAGGRSRVDDRRFFLSAAARPTAAEELHATLAGARLPVADDPNRHPGCRFPARYRWLQEQGLLTADDGPAISCPDYQQWRQQVSAERVSLIFPAAFMNSPSSMYGHTFLRFDPANAAAGSLWLSWALNFGANISTEDNSLLYAYKGLFGGYPGQFNMMPYYRKIQEYNRMENRDMWEYPLDLSAAEVDRLLEHVWELKEVNFDYFFFDENCSFQLLELLDLVRPDAHLTAAFEWHAIPADTVRAVVNAGMVEGVAYRPANQTRFDALAATLTDAERDLLVRLSRQPTDSAADFERLPAERQRLLVQGAYDYLRLAQDGGVRDADANRRSYQLLQRINRQPAAPLPAPETPTDPVLGHYSGLARAGLGRRAGVMFTELGFRAAYQDLLDADQGFPAGSQLEMGELGLRLYAGGNLKPERFDLVSIRSLPPRSALFQPWSWQVQAGYERVYSDADWRDNGVAQVTGGGGLSYAANRQRTTLFGLLTGRLEFNDRFADPLALGLGLDLGARHDFGALQGIAELNLLQLSNGQLRRQFDLGAQYHLTRQSGVRAGFSRRHHDDGRVDHALLIEYRHHLL